MPVGLNEIVAATRRRLDARRLSTDLAALRKQALVHRPRGFRQALAASAKVAAGLRAPAITIIAELKKASPSKGLLRAGLDVSSLARQLEGAGAAALSVLTEEDFFLGSLANLRQASAACALPCLRKDFIVDELQILEARAHGGDAVLLLASVLGDGELRRLLACARELGLDALCEAHDAAELDRVLDAGSDLVGVNSRDLRSFQVDLNTPLRLAARMPAEVVKVAESGIHTGADLRRLQAAGTTRFSLASR